MHLRLRSGLPLLTFLSVVSSELSEGRVQDAPAFLGNFLIEDSCQFQLCGSSYSREWGGEPPLAGSCSGDCSLLAITLNNNKFHKEFLWSSCARMCGTKFPADRFPEYKDRFLCMESCYSSYSLVSPHHNIARYCMQAACNTRHAQKGTFQIDCFEGCTKHVSSSLPESMWRVWARAIASSTCNNQTDELNSRLKCGDEAVWEHISTVHEKAAQHHADLCINNVCNQQVKCGLSCLEHIHKLQKPQRPDWVACTKSADCSVKQDWHARQSCSDRCLTAIQQQRELEEAELRSQSQSQLQLQLSSSAAGTSFLAATTFLVVATFTHTLV